MSDLKGMHRVRWVVGNEPEMQCGTCYEYLPLSVEFWVPSHGVRKCRACWRDHQRPRVREAQRAIRRDPERLEAERVARRAEYQANIGDRRDYARDWYRRNRSRLAMAQRAGQA